MRYFDLIFTLHAQEQLRERGVKLEDAWETFKHPNRSEKGKGGTVQFEKEFSDFKISIIAFLNRKNEWVVKTAWRNPALPGTDDDKKKKEWKKYNKAKFWGKLWIEIKQQLGL